MKDKTWKVRNGSIKSGRYKMLFYDMVILHTEI